MDQQFATGNEMAQSARLRGKVALITGGTSGIGLATARLFAAEGARVVGTGTTDQSVAAARAILAADERAGNIDLVRSDAGDAGAVSVLLSEIASRFGGIDILFLNAGIVRNALLAELDERVFDEVMRVNVRGPFLSLKYATPLLRPNGSVVINTSVANQLGIPGAGVYAASKAALRSLVRTAAAELMDRGIRVNAISPGPTNTPVYGRQGLPPEMVPHVVQRMKELVPQHRLAEAREIAKTVLFLASSDASFITGEELMVDGGMSAL